MVDMVVDLDRQVHRSFLAELDFLLHCCFDMETISQFSNLKPLIFCSLETVPPVIIVFFAVMLFIDHTCAFKFVLSLSLELTV